MSVGVVNKTTGDRIQTAGDPRALTFDDVPTNGSTNPVKSDGIYDALVTKANQSQIATVEASTTASKAYSANEYLVLGGVLYKVTANIAQGGTIVTEGAGKNVDLATVGGELSAINSNLTNYELQNTINLEVSDRKNLAGNPYNVLLNSNGVFVEGTVRTYIVPTSYGKITISVDDITKISDGVIRLGYCDNIPVKNGTGVRISNMDTNTYTITPSTSYKYFVVSNLLDVQEGWQDIQIEIGDTATAYTPYIPSVETRLDTLDSNLTSCNNYKRRSRRDISSDLTNLATAISEQDLEKYGYSIGDYFVSTGFTGATGYTYVLADMDTFYGGHNNNAVVSTHHISLVVKTGANSKWAETNDTSGGYKNSTLHTYLSTTVLDNIKADMIHFFGGSTGLEHLVSHNLLWTTATSGAWAWSDNAEYISALSEPQVYGTNVWAVDGYQTGEAWKWLEVFHKFSFNQIIGNIWWWLRSICSTSHACRASGNGGAHNNGASDSVGAVGLILFH